MGLLQPPRPPPREASALSSTDSSLRVAVVGAGLMGRWHAHYAKRSGARVVAVVDSSANAAALLARRAGDAAVFEAMGAMLAAAQPHVVHICTPLFTHLPLALQAVEAGVHALVEKPLTATASQSQALLQRAQENGVHVCPVHQFAFQRGVAHAAAALGQLGEPLHASFTICSAGGDGQTGDAWDAIVADILPHPLSVLQALWPRHSLRCDDWSAQSPRHGELLVQGRSGDVPVAIYVSMSARPTRCDLEVLCSAGSVQVNFFHGYATVRHGRPSRADKILQPFRQAGSTAAMAGANLAGRAWRREWAYPGLATLVSAFHAAAGGTGSNPISMADSLAVAWVREHLVHGVVSSAMRDAAGDGQPPHPDEHGRARAL